MFVIVIVFGDQIFVFVGFVYSSRALHSKFMLPDVFEFDGKITLIENELSNMFQILTFRTKELKAASELST